MDRVGIQDPGCRQDVRDDVQGPESLVHRDLEDRCGGVERGIDGTSPSGTPSTTYTIATLAAVPGLCKNRLIQPPQDDVTLSERRWERRHV